MTKLNLEQARSLARYAFARLWRSHAMTPRTACAWLRTRFGVDTVDDLTTIGECIDLAERVSDWWAERCADRCNVCRVPVRLEHTHEIVDGELYHARCVPTVQRDAR